MDEQKRDLERDAWDAALYSLCPFISKWKLDYLYGNFYNLVLLSTFFITPWILFRELSSDHTSQRREKNCSWFLCSWSQRWNYEVNRRTKKVDLGWENMIGESIVTNIAKQLMRICVSAFPKIMHGVIYYMCKLSYANLATALDACTLSIAHLMDG